jgi:hypothetical protein
MGWLRDQVQHQADAAEPRTGAVVRDHPRLPWVALGVEVGVGATRKYIPCNMQYGICPY